MRGDSMSEQVKQIIKAFAYSVDIETISENTGMSKEECRQFAETYNDAIAEEMAWNKKKAGG